jgi:bifunctional DNA-binding transcriptional regulator/antitoxin component of YhaV-PrlF toxin-antitoxin module
MTIANYRMRVDERGALIIPKEAQEILQLRPGEEVQVSIDRIPATTPAPNEKMLSILRDIQERHKERPYSDPADTDRLIQEARSGAMYGDERSE